MILFDLAPRSAGIARLGIVPMDEDKTPNSGFRVVDKRRFTDAGDTKNLDSSAESSGPAVTAKAAERSSVVREPVVSSITAPKDSRDGGSPPNATSIQGDATEPFEVDFSSFVVSLATQALAVLGEVPSRETGGITVNLEAAKQMIDILGMLEQKTKGNLTADEGRMLTEILSSIRIAYVNRVKDKR